MNYAIYTNVHGLLTLIKYNKDAKQFEKKVYDLYSQQEH